jgi:hypothetical protein
MFAFLAYIAAAISLIASFFSPRWAWIPIVAVDAFMIVTLRNVRRGFRVRRIPELSDAANALFQEHSHFYLMPFAGASFSAAASTMTLAGVPVGIIGAFKGFFWGLAFAAINYAGMGFVASRFNPVHWLRGAEGPAHDELVAYLEQHQNSDRLP